MVSIEVVVDCSGSAAERLCERSRGDAESSKRVGSGYSEVPRNGSARGVEGWECHKEVQRRFVG